MGMTNLCDDKATLAELTAQELLNAVYPVGSIYISTNATKPSLGTWVQLSTGYSLWNVSTSDSNLGQKIVGSAPLIKGCKGADACYSDDQTSGAFYRSGSTSPCCKYSDSRAIIHFDASRCSAVYNGDAGNTVLRPTSIGVTMWQRTA